MQNDVLYNRVMNKVLILTIKATLIDPDDPFSGYDYTLINATMGPVAFKNLLPPASALIKLVDADGRIMYYEYAQGFSFDQDDTSVSIFTQNIMIDGFYDTDSWQINA